MLYCKCKVAPAATPSGQSAVPGSGWQFIIRQYFKEVIKMLWTWPGRNYGTVWQDLDRLQQEMSRIFEPSGLRRAAAGEFPAVNVWANDDNAVVTAELPGINPKDLEVTVKNDTVTLRGSRRDDELKKGEEYLRRERGTGTFVRTFSLPFHVNGDKVTAQYRMGILQLTLPRAEADKPKRISVSAG